MKVTPDSIKASVATHFRYKYQNYIIAFEADNADVLLVDKDNFLTEIEVKVTMGDLRRDKAKRKHFWYNNGEPIFHLPRLRFYFAVPKDMANKAVLLCEQHYPYAGVIGSDGKGGDDVELYRKAKHLNPATQLSPVEVKGLVKQQSGTLCRMAMKMNGIKYSLVNN